MVSKTGTFDNFGAAHGEFSNQLVDAIESMRDGFALYDSDERLVYCNNLYRNFYPSIAKMLKRGARHEDLTRTAYETGAIRGSPASTEALIEQHLSRYRTAEGTHEQQLEDGRWLLCSDRRTPTGCFACNRTDITDRKLLEEATSRFETLADKAPIGIFFTNTEGVSRYVNQALSKIAGYPANELIGELWHNKIHPDDRDTVTKQWLANVNNVEPWNSEYRFQDPDGNVTWVVGNTNPQFDDKGNVVSHVGTITDITLRKRAEEELQENYRLFRMAESMGNMGHWTWDQTEYRITSCSEQFARIYGMTVPEALTHFTSLEADLDFIHPDDKERFMQAQSDIEYPKKGLDIQLRIITASGIKRHIYLRSEHLLDDNGAIIRSFGTVQDITERKGIEEKLSHQVSHDALTGLINRPEFEQRTNRLLSTIQKDKAEHAMCFLDLDQFKIINDTCGHVAGDELLRQLGKLLQNTVRKRDTLARLGGDEFGVLMEHCSLDQAHRVADSILEAIKGYQFSWEGEIFRIGVSIGLIAITEATGNFTDLFKQSDAACYLAKELGRNRIHVYHPDDAELAVRYGEMQWLGRIHHALDENRFSLYAQPIVSLDSGDLKHYELLVRMLGEGDEIIPPGAFLPAAERYNLIEKLDAWVVERAISLMASHSVFIEQVNFISINLSGQSVANAQFMLLVIAQISESNIDASKICFEVTETAAISNLSAATTFIATLKDLGCRFALDDFGSGFSSFGYLKNLPVDYLKIDGMFVKDIVDDPIDHAMVKSINEIGHVMGMKTIAEFVENDAINNKLIKIGVDYAQGYGIGKPQPFDDILKL